MFIPGKLYLLKNEEELEMEGLSPADYGMDNDLVIYPAFELEFVDRDKTIPQIKLVDKKQMIPGLVIIEENQMLLCCEINKMVIDTVDYIDIENERKVFGHILLYGDKLILIEGQVHSKFGPSHFKEVCEHV